MPPSIHKILFHGADIMAYFPLPIGMMSEEALECGNKNFKKARKFHSRTVSRLANNEDVFLKLLTWSDPKISKMRQPLLKTKSDLNTDAKQLLK